MTKTISTSSASSAHTADKSAVSNAASSQLGDVSAVAPVMMSRMETTSDWSNAVMVRADQDVIANDMVMVASPSDAMAAWLAENAGLQATSGSETLTLMAALGVAQNDGINIDELLAGIKAPKAEMTPVVADAIPVATVAPTAADMLALQDMLANMEPASGESGGGAGRAGGAGFGSSIDPAILLGLDRLGGILSTASLGLGDALSGRRSGLGDDGLNIRTVSLAAANNDAASSDDSKVFDGSPDLFGTGNVLENDHSTSGALILKTVTLNGVIHHVPESGSIDIMGVMGLLSIASNGDYAYAPLDAKDLGADISGIDLFEYTAEDAAGIVTTATLAVTVNDKIPVAVDDVIAADHMNLTRTGTLLSGDQLGNGAMRLAMVNGQDIGPEGITINRPDLGYKIVIAADGSYTLTAENLRTGVDTLTYSTIDADGDASGVATVAISFADTAPTLTSKAVASTNMNLVTTGSLISGSDVVGDGSVHVGSVAGQLMPAGGSLVLDTADYILTIQQNGDYRLEGKNGHTATNIQIPITTVDSDGDISNTAVITVSVRDRVPEVMEESTTVQGGLNLTTQAITGVVNGVLVPDTMGDGGHRYELISSTQGRFGTITLGSDGYYRYDLNSTKDVLTNTPDLFEKISYRVTDEDGDTSVSDFYIIIDTDGSWQLANLLPHGVDETVTLQGALNVVTQQIAGAITGNVLSNGDTVGNNPATVTLLNGTGQGLFGSIVINANGSYTYTLDARATKTSLQGPLVQETFIYEITDADGDMSTAAITIQIRPDGSWSQDNFVPVASGEIVAIDGHLNLATQHVTGSISGTVLDSQDSLGDGLARVEIVGSTQGAHGRLTLNADGTYTYALDDAKSNLQGTPTDTFTYRIVDRDGDVSNTVTLTVRIGSDGSWSQSNATPTAVDDIGFSNASADVSGNVITASDHGGDGALRVVSVERTTAGMSSAIAGVGVALVGKYGALVLNADGSYVYTADKSSHGGGNVDINDVDTFKYTITDKDGDTTTAVLTISVHDQLPVAYDGVGVVDNFRVLSGNLLNDYQLSGEIVGGDGTVSLHTVNGQIIPTGGYIDIVVAGQYTMRVHSDGTYLFTAADQQTGTAHVSVSLIDSDGDISNVANLDIQYNDNGVTAVSVLETVTGELIGTHVMGTLSGTIDVPGTNAGDGPSSASLVGSSTGKFGTIIMNGDGTFTYTLDADKNAMRGDLTERFTYMITDNDGDTSTATLSISIASDGSWVIDNTTPIATDGNGGTSLGEVAITGNIVSSLVTSGNGSKTITSISINGGAAIAVSATDSVHAGTHGTLTIRADGTYSYVGKDDASGTDVITYTVRDADGDTATATLRLDAIDISPDAHDDVIVTSNMALIKTGNIMTGVNAVSDTVGDGTTRVEYVVLNGTRYDIAAGRGVDIALGDGSTIQIGSDGAYTMSGANQKSGSATLTYGLVDSDGDRDTASVSLTWADRTPVATDDIDSFVASLTDVVNQRVTATINASINSVGIQLGDNGTFSLISNAKGTYGTIIIHSDGTYTYNLDADKSALVAAYKNTGSLPEDVFTYRITDADGDTSEAKLIMRVQDDNGSTWNLNNTSPDINDVTNNSVATQITPVSGMFPIVAAGDGILSLKVNGIDIPVNDTNVNIDGANGVLTIRTDKSFISYSYIAKDHANGSDTFNLTLTDKDGDRDTATLTLHGFDALPTANAVTASGSGNGNSDVTVGGNLLASPSGGDGVLRVLSIAGHDIPAGQQITLTGAQLGLSGLVDLLSVNSNGGYSVIASKGANLNNIPLSFTIIDQDGDTSSSNLILSISNSDAVASTPGLSVDPLTMNEDGSARLIIRTTNNDPDSEKLTVTATIPSGWTVVDAAGGTVSGNVWTRALGVGENLSGSGPIVQPPANWNGSTNISVSVTSTETNSGAVSSPVSVSASVSVAAVNDAPTDTNPGSTATGNIQEGANVGTSILTITGISDVDSVGTWTLSGPGKDNFNILPDGTITNKVVLDADAATGGTSVYNLTATFSDGQDSVSRNVQINVGNTNDNAPIIGVSSVTNPREDAGIGTTVATVSKSDTDGDNVTLSIVGGADGKFTIDQNGNITVSGALDAEMKNSYDIVVRASDGVNVTDKVITIGVGNVNEAPSINALSAWPTVNENQGAVNVVQMTGSDPDASSGDRIQWSIVSGNTSLFQIDANTGWISTTGSLNYEDSHGYDLIVRATDSSGLTVDRSISVNVGNVNEQAVITGGTSGSVNENDTSTVIMRVTATDPDGDAVTWSLVGNDANQFRIDATTGEIRVASWSGGLNFENPVGMDVYAVATSNGQSTQTGRLSISVNDVNEAPIMLGYTNVMNRKEDAATQSNNWMITSLGAYDPEGNLSGWQITGGTGLGKFSISTTGIVSATQLFDYESMGADKSFTLEIQAVDAGGLTSGTAYITVNIENVNEVGSISGPDVASVDEEQGTTTYVTQMSVTNDPEGNAQSWSIIGGTGVGRFTIDSNGVIRTNDVFNFESGVRSYTLTVQADDGQGGRVTKDITVNINPVNEAVAITGGLSGSVAENNTSTVITSVTASDSDGDAITWSLSGRDAGRFTIDANGNIRATGAGLDYETRPSDGYQVYATATTRDSQETRAVSIGVTDVYENHIPVAVIDTTISGNLMANDVIEDGPGRVTQITYQSLVTNTYEDWSVGWVTETLFGDVVTIDLPQNGTNLVINDIALMWDGQYILSQGTLTVNSNGGYSLSLNGATGASMQASYTLVDNNGDRATGQISYKDTDVSIWTYSTPSWVTVSALDVNDNTGSVYRGNHFAVNGGRKDHEIDFVHDVTYGEPYWVDGESNGGWVTPVTPLSTGHSEKLIFNFNGNTASSATVYLWGLNNNDPTGGPELGHWIAYRNGNIVAQADFSGAQGSTLTIPNIVGGFDQIVFSALAMPTGQQWDSSDYGVTGIVLHNVTMKAGPLVLDLNHDGHVNLLSSDAGVMFDMTNDGVKDHTGWVGPQDGQLAVDLNHNGIIDNQNELFGSPIGSTLDVNGFTKLATYDDNHDGIISSMDSIWSKLIVWQDLNQDGISQANEMKSVVEYQIASIDTGATRVDTEIAGNAVYWDGHATMTDGSSMSVVDAYYQVLDGATATHDASTTPAIAADTSSIDAAISATLTEQLSASETTDLDAAIHEFLLATGKDDVVTIDPVPVARDVVAVSIDPIVDDQNNPVL